MQDHDSKHRGTSVPARKKQMVAAATITIVGGSLAIDGIPVEAATFSVTNTNANGSGSLLQAIIDANAAAGPDTITFSGAGASGTISLSLPGAKITDDLTIIGPGEAVLSLTNPTGDVLYVYNADFTVSGLTITGAGADGIHSYLGGDLTVTDVTITDITDSGIYLSNATDDMTDTVVISRVDVSNTGNTGIYINEVMSVDIDEVTVDDAGAYGLSIEDALDVTISDSTITDSTDRGITIYPLEGPATITDTVIERSGDNGLYIDGSDNYDDTVVIERVTVTDSDDDGMYLRGPSAFVLRDVTIENSGGGGIYISDDHKGATLERVSVTTSDGDGIRVGEGQDTDIEISMTEVTIDGSTDTGLVLYYAGDVTLDGITITESGEDGVQLYELYGDVAVSNMSVSTSGGAAVVPTDGIGLYLRDNPGNVEIQSTTVTASRQEALVVSNSAGNTVFVNSTFSENDSTTANGVLVVDSDLTLAHSTISGNTNTGAAVIGLDVTSNLVLDHAIVAGNGGDVSHAGGASVAGSFSLLATGSGLGGTNIETADPLLGALADNGGPTRTMLPSALSPAVEAGDPAFVAPPALDQRGQARVVGPVIDIGAVELLGDAITPLAPARFLDTRTTGETIDNQFEKGGKLDAGEEITVQIAGRGDVPANAVGVVMNVTAVAGEAVGFVTVHPCVSPRPLASSINYTPGVNLGNELVSGLDASGQVCLYSKEAVHLTIDVVGYVVANSPLRNVTPARLLDTRPTGKTIDGVSQAAGRPGAGSSTTVKVAGRGGVPADARTVIVNVTAVKSTERGFVTVTPCADPIPTASSLNYVAATNRANELVAELNSNGELCLFTSSDAHLLVDVVGYVGSPSSFTSVAPSRLLDSRPTGTTIDAQDQGVGKRQAGTSYTLDVEGRVGVPASATAVVVNITAVAPEGRGYVTVHPCLSTLPLASSLNFVQGVNGPNEIVATLSADGKICLFNSTTTHLVVDIVGYLE